MKKLEDIATAKKEAGAFIEKNTTSKQRGGLSLNPWGLALDYEETKNMPPEYIGADFYEMDHSEVVRFFMMSNEEKFLYAYWAQRWHAQRGVRHGFIFGFATAGLLALIVAQIFF